MNIQQPALDFTARPALSALLARPTRCARIAALLLAHRGEWVDGRQIAAVGGAYAWRTRVSDLRKAPWFLTVENRQRWTGRSVVSEYRISHG